MAKKPEILAAFEKTRVFSGKYAESVKKRYGKANARRVVEMCETMDEIIRTLREGILLDSVMPEMPIADVVLTKAKKPAGIRLKTESKVIH